MSDRGSIHHLNPVADCIQNNFTVSDVAMILGVFLVCEQPESQAVNVRQHVDLPADQAIINKMILICSNDQHILGNPIRNRFQVI